MVSSAFYSIGKNGHVNKNIKYWNSDYFGYIVGNAMLTFMWHHSLPNLLRPFRPEK